MHGKFVTANKLRIQIGRSSGGGAFTCPKGHLSEMYRHRVRVRVRISFSVKFRNLNNSILDK